MMKEFKLPRPGTEARFMIDLIIKSGKIGLTRKEIMTEVFKVYHRWSSGRHTEYDAVQHRGYKASYFTWREQYGIIPKLCNKISRTNKWVFKHLDVLEKERDATIFTLYLNDVYKSIKCIPHWHLTESLPEFKLSYDEKQRIADTVIEWNKSPKD